MTDSKQDRFFSYSLIKGCLADDKYCREFKQTAERREFEDKDGWVIEYYVNEDRQMLITNVYFKQTATSAHEVAEKFTKEMQTKYPQIGFSFGYIGNVDKWGDDRCWAFFTTVPKRSEHFVYRLGDTQDMKGTVVDLIQEGIVEDWIVKRVLPNCIDLPL